MFRASTDDGSGKPFGDKINKCTKQDDSVNAEIAAPARSKSSCAIVVAAVKSSSNSSCYEN
ncbi:MAG: hypothetical protein ACJ719_06165 [Nitrososphaeraceae archaeon]